MSFRVGDVEVEGLEEVERAWERAVAEIRVGVIRGVGLGAKEGAEEARRVHQWQSRTGNLERSIGHIVLGWTSEGTYVAQIFAKAKYASYLEEGTQPHLIAGDPFLAFEWKGEKVFFRYVNHPGTRPMPFMGPALQKAERVVQREVELGVARAEEIMSR